MDRAAQACWLPGPTSFLLNGCSDRRDAAGRYLDLFLADPDSGNSPFRLGLWFGVMMTVNMAIGRDFQWP
jgi:hypothetical protein